MSEPSKASSSPDPQSEQRVIPVAPSEKRLAWMRLVCALLGLAAFCGVWALTGSLGTWWRIGIGLLVAGPFLVIPDLVRDKSAPPPGFVPRKWEDEDD